MTCEYAGLNKKFLGMPCAFLSYLVIFPSSDFTVFSRVIVTDRFMCFAITKPSHSFVFSPRDVKSLKST